MIWMSFLSVLCHEGVGEQHILVLVLRAMAFVD